VIPAVVICKTSLRLRRQPPDLNPSTLHPSSIYATTSPSSRRSCKSTRDFAPHGARPLSRSAATNGGGANGGTVLKSPATMFDDFLADSLKNCLRQQLGFQATTSIRVKNRTMS
jgi:hypothetical protein